MAQMKDLLATRHSMEEQDNKLTNRSVNTLENVPLSCEGCGITVGEYEVSGISWLLCNRKTFATYKKLEAVEFLSFSDILLTHEL